MSPLRHLPATAAKCGYSATSLASAASVSARKRATTSGLSLMGLCRKRFVIRSQRSASILAASSR